MPVFTPSDFSLSASGLLETGFKLRSYPVIITMDVSINQPANCITENVTIGSIVASGKMLLSDRRKSQSEEQHDEPEKQARVVSSSTILIPESEQG
jgi:hypothetical protein